MLLLGTELLCETSEPLGTNTPEESDGDPGTDSTESPDPLNVKYRLLQLMWGMYNELSRDLLVSYCWGKKKFQMRARMWQKPSYIQVKRGLASGEGREESIEERGSLILEQALEREAGLGGPELIEDMSLVSLLVFLGEADSIGINSSGLKDGRE
jgi:hypothetical protein